MVPLRKRRRVLHRPVGRRRLIVAVLLALATGIVVNFATRPRLSEGTGELPLESSAALEGWSDSAGQAALYRRRLTRLASECPTASAERRRAVLDSFARWNDDVLGMVACRRIKPGFTAEQLRAAWGAPATIIPDLNGMLPIEQWDYGHRSVLVSDGRVKSWQ
jgi:hypothetical protein